MRVPSCSRRIDPSIPLSLEERRGRQKRRREGESRGTWLVRRRDHRDTSRGISQISFLKETNVSVKKFCHAVRYYRKNRYSTWTKLSLAFAHILHILYKLLHSSICQIYKRSNETWSFELNINYYYFLVKYVLRIYVYIYVRTKFHHWSRKKWKLIAISALFVFSIIPPLRYSQKKIN